jgi:UDP-N-acetylglucosamine 2-epimerase (non-hydrolysing)
MSVKLLLIAGARPNFMKIAPVIRELQRRADRFDYRLVHTGQHYDEGMSEVFFRDLGIPAPHHHLNVGSGSHAAQTARIMTAFEPVLLEEQPDVVLVFGDVNSTLACSIVAKKLNYPVAHVEAGLRSGDRTMPEEINRIVTDSISDLFFVTEQSGVDNLRRDGHAEAQIHFVGHVMIDNLFYEVEQLKKLGAQGTRADAYKTAHPHYGVVTLHRPSNVDDAAALAGIITALGNIGATLPLAFPVHPRTRKNFETFGIEIPATITLLDPLGYREFLHLWKDAAIVLTDSGGLQEETTALGIPCVTLRENTERPVTVSDGTNILAGNNPAAILTAAARQIERAKSFAANPPRPALWDGHAAERIVAVLGGESRRAD